MVKCSYGYSVSGDFCYSLAFPFSAYIQSDSKASGAGESCSHVAAQVSQGTVVYYWAAPLGSSYPSQQGGKPPLGISSNNALQWVWAAAQHSTVIWNWYLQVCRFPNGLTPFWKGPLGKCCKSCTSEQHLRIWRAWCSFIARIREGCSDFLQLKGVLKLCCSCSVCGFVGLLV